MKTRDRGERLHEPLFSPLHFNFLNIANTSLKVHPQSLPASSAAMTKPNNRRFRVPQMSI